MVRKLSPSELILYFGGPWTESMVSRKARKKAIANFVQEVVCDGYIRIIDVKGIVCLALEMLFYSRFTLLSMSESLLIVVV